MAINLNLNDLSFDNIGAWPKPIKIIVVILLAAAICGLGYWFDTQKQLQRKGVLAKQEQSLRKEFEEKQHLAANLRTYRVQIEQMKRSFGDMLRQLPSKTEVPGLLEDISKAGVASGLEFKLFDPAEEIQHEFYSELPIHMSVVGTYHQLGEFVSRVASLDRIVTLHDVNITVIDDKQGNKSSANNLEHESLQMKITAKTYRYTEGEEQNSGAETADQTQQSTNRKG